MAGKYIEAPTYIDLSITKEEKNIFLAGSITEAWDWQAEVKDKLLPYYNVFNPRRSSFDISNPLESRHQIIWEYCHLKVCSHILFWFSHETLAPITLFEYGTLVKNYTNASKYKLYVGIDPNYQRCNDVLIQTELYAPDLKDKIVFSIPELTDLVINEP